MTICASVKVRDGLVLATDSMTQISVITPEGDTGVAKTYSNARKLFQVGDTPIGVMFHGIGNIGKRSIQGFMREFRPSNSSNVKKVATELYAHFKGPYDERFAELDIGSKPVLGFYIAGYSKNGEFAEEWEFRYPKDSEPRVVREDKSFGASWRGVDLPFTRIYKGYDPRSFDLLLQQGVDPKTVKQLKQISKNLESPVIYDGMPVQDAINFAVYILNTTIGLVEFEIGPPICGGPLQVATILPEHGFEWISRPNYSIHQKNK